MDWFAQINAYCERGDASYWAEPVNAVTNLSFIIAAAIMWPRSAGLPMARVLCVILFVIGVGSYLFHTHATAWAALADVVPIGLFILTYLFAINRDAVPLRTNWAVLATLLFIPYAALLVPVLHQIPFVRISNFYWTVPILLMIYAVFLRHHAELARGFWVGAAILTVSITFRSLDARLCAALPIGTHFMWHLLNGVMLGWMIEVYRRHMLAGRTA
ncbi:ceramidase domain-containing protein [Yoonia sp.]|uniref:ceramidase domain-containing protein n=1 Tax=Yoonia sp. TaxID=2212373 RepID=UPI0019E04A70|nr:ceramidase domain-containing protein [Yoonia sp.]MBE0412498.1 ceramidase domain-containing protein [Yoonia sp.]